MLKILALLVTLNFSPTVLACETQKNLSLAKRIIREINSIRAEPISYVQRAEQQWKNSYQLKNAAIALCKGLKNAQAEFDKALLLLKKQKPLAPYKKNGLLDKVACDIIADMATGDRVNPLHESYNKFFKAHLTSKKYNHSVSVSSGMTNPRDIVIRFLIGDCQFKGSQGNQFRKDNIFWRNLFSSDFDQAGAACDHHPLSQFDGPKIMCAHTILKKGGANKIKSGYQQGFEEL